VEAAKEDFQNLGLHRNVTVTHRDVLAEGFMLEQKEGEHAGVKEGTLDAIFLDLPSPQKAAPYAYKVLRKQGVICNFSPCIEQVQAVANALVKLGFYDIRTFECLSKSYENEAFYSNRVYGDELKEDQLADKAAKRRFNKGDRKN